MKKKVRLARLQHWGGDFDLKHEKKIRLQEKKKTHGKNKKTKNFKLLGKTADWRLAWKKHAIFLPMIKSERAVPVGWRRWCSLWLVVVVGIDEAVEDASGIAASHVSSQLGFLRCFPFPLFAFAFYFPLYTRRTQTGRVCCSETLSRKIRTNRTLTRASQTLTHASLCNTVPIDQVGSIFVWNGTTRASQNATRASLTTKRKSNINKQLER